MIAGGKFANGAASGAFVHLFNAEWRASVSVSGGAGVGGTIEKGLTLAHDSNQPWYKGWSFGYFKTNGVGVYTNVEISTEISVGDSDINHVDSLNGTSVTTRVSFGTVLDVAYEIVIILRTYSLGVSTPTPVPFETHVYKTETEVTCLFGGKKEI